jgi:hypothetical protein
VSESWRACYSCGGGTKPAASIRENTTASEQEPVVQNVGLCLKGEEMVILRIEHRVPSYAEWKQAFDSDPVDRKGSGVRRYRILRGLDDPGEVMIDLEFDTKSEAEALLNAMRHVWERVEGTVMYNPQTWIIEVVESREL